MANRNCAESRPVDVNGVSSGDQSSNIAALPLAHVLAGENAVKFWVANGEMAHKQTLTQLYAQLRCKLVNVGFNWFEDAVQAEASVTVFYDLLQIGYREVIEHVTGVFAQLSAQTSSEANDILILPVRYGGDVGCDIAEVAARADMTVEQVITLHQQTLFQVSAVGFSPGFGYLKGLPAALQLPRRDSPRTRVPAGALAIAEAYSAVYPQSSPGGWHLIGYCEEKLFDVNNDSPALFKVGQRVRFKAV